MLTPGFSISQSALNPALILATDTSTGSDGAISARRIFFQTSQGIYLVESGITTNYNIWALANTSQNFNVLTTDQALSITTQWVDVSGTVLYSLTQVFCLAEFNKQFLVYLGQQQALTPTILQDANYATNWAVFWLYITQAINMIEIAADISNSQNLLGKATSMRQQEAKYF